MTYEKVIFISVAINLLMSLAIRYKIGYLCDLNDLWNIEIGSHWGQAFPNQVGLVRLLTMHVHHVLF